MFVSQLKESTTGRKISIISHDTDNDTTTKSTSRIQSRLMVMVLMLMVLMFQVHTILSPGDNLGLVIRGGAEYGVSWPLGWWSWDHLIFCFERLSHYCHQVGIYVLQVDQNSLAESLGLQVYLYTPYTQSECLIQILQIISPSISPLVVFVHPLKLFLIIGPESDHCSPLSVTHSLTD